MRISFPLKGTDTNFQPKKTPLILVGASVLLRLAEPLCAAATHGANETSASKDAVFSVHVSTALGACITSLGSAWMAALFFFFKRLQYHLSELMLPGKAFGELMH